MTCVIKIYTEMGKEFLSTSNTATSIKLSLCKNKWVQYSNNGEQCVVHN